MNINLQELRLAIIGLGYVGLPLAIEFGKKRDVIGFDVNIERINQLEKFYDSTLEVSEKDIQNANKLKFTHQVDQISNCNCFIVTVPTPIDKNKNPDLSPIQNASEMISMILKKNDLVIYESTVYPGATEEFCVPILEANSGLKFNRDFFCGYSPERINPGDKEHRLVNITKVTSGSTEDIANIVDSLYKEIVTAGTHKAESIKVAEAAKVIENTQRDLNIALINELAVIFNQMDIDTEAVLKAAGSKWNFLPFKPGLVGGHCIGVDPYYLTHKAQSIGYKPEVILAGRKLNDGMGKYVAQQLEKAFKDKGISISDKRVLIMGLSFKENCPDLRNTKVIDTYAHLKELECLVDCYDPWIDEAESQKLYGIKLVKKIKANYYDAILLAVNHKEFIDLGSKGIKEGLTEGGIFYDMKSIFPKEESSLRL